MLAHTLDGKLNVVGQGDLDVRAQVVAQHASCYVDNLGAYLKVVERKVAHELNIAWLDVVKGVVNKVEVNVFAHGAVRQAFTEGDDLVASGVDAQHGVVVNALEYDHGPSLDMKKRNRHNAP